MIYSYLDGKSPEHSNFRRNLQLQKSPKQISLSCHMLNSCIKKQDSLYRQGIKIDKVILVGKICGINFTKSPKGIQITQLKVKDDSSTIIVSIYKNQFPNDLINDLLSRNKLKSIFELINKYIKTKVTIKQSTNKSKPFTFICYNISLIQNYNDIIEHILSIIYDECSNSYGEM